MNNKLFIVTLGFLFLSNAAFAADPNLIIGLWIQKFPNGNGMVTEFTQKTMSSYSVDALGKQTSPNNTADVAYRDLGDTIAIDFQKGGGAIVLVKTENSIMLDFPGQGAFPLTRWKPKP